MKKVYISSSPRQTALLAQLLAEEVSKTKPRRQALVIALIGELGTGKTTFIRSFLRALGIKKRITSPTFVMLRRYPLGRAGFFEQVFHFDAYRIRRASEASALGWTEILARPENLILVEWADKIKSILPSATLWLRFNYGRTTKERHIVVG